MARGITKTTPMGVRFDKDLLEGLQLAGIVDSPQRALNLYEKSYLELVEIRTKILQSSEIIEEITEPLVEPEIEKQVEQSTEPPKKITMRERIAMEKLNLNTKK